MVNDYEKSIEAFKKAYPLLKKQEACIEWQKKSMHPIALRHREINGRNMYGHAPTMRGMLSYLQQ